MKSDETTNFADVTPFPNLATDWSDANPEHPSFVQVGVDDTPGNKAYLIHMEAKPGKEEALQAFMQDINTGVHQEPGTGPWFGVRYSKSTFFIVEAFPDAEARHTHDVGPGGGNFLRADELREILVAPARLYRVDVLFGKFDVMFGKPVVAAYA